MSAKVLEENEGPSYGITGPVRQNSDSSSDGLGESPVRRNKDPRAAVQRASSYKSQKQSRSAVEM